MALNPPLISDPLGGKPIPAGISGEYFLLARDALEFKAGLLQKTYTPGRLYITTLRLVLVPDKPTPGFFALDIPLQGILAESFVQPVFSSNRLEFTLANIPGRGLQGETTPVSIKFSSGGCATLLKVFFRVMERWRSPPPTMLPTFSPMEAASVAEEFAYFSPNDPSRVFTYAQQPGPR